MSNRDSISDWPYNVWSNIIASFSTFLLNDDIVLESKKKKCAAFLENLSKNCQWLVLPKNPHSDEYVSSKDDCKCFNIWLFGQLFSVFRQDLLKENYGKCMDAQIELLLYLWENDPPMYRVILQCYLSVLEELCMVFPSKDEAFQPTAYDWFNFVVTNEKLYLPRATFKVDNFSQLQDLVRQILMLFKSQMPFNFNVCPSVLSLVWKCLLSLLKKYPNKAPVYQIISQLLSHDLSIAKPKYHAKIANLLLYVLDDISTLCQVGKLTEEEDFCSMLDILGKTRCLPFSVDFAYAHNVYSLLLHNQVLLNELTEETVLCFFNKTLQMSYFDETGVKLESNLNNMNLSLLRSLLQFTLEDTMRRKKTELTSTRPINIYRSNKFWKFLVEQILIQAQNVNTCIVKEVVHFFKLVLSVTQSAVSLTYEFNLEFIFFEEKILDIIKELRKLSECRVDEKIFYLLLNIIKNVLMLDESLAFGENDRMWLLQLFYTRWVCHTPNDSMYQKYLSLQNEKLRNFCIMNIMWTHQFLPNNWKSELFARIFEDYSATIIQLVPVFASKLNDADVASFTDHMLKSSVEIMTKLSTLICPLICALSGNYSLTKLPESEIDLVCCVCDRKQVLQQVAPVNRCDLMSVVVEHMMQSSEEARYNVISNIVRLFNHIPKSEKLLHLLRDCFLIESCKIREKIIEVTPSVIFKDLDGANYAYDEEVFQSFRKCLRAVTLFSLVNEDSHLQFVCLNAITKIGCVPLEITLLPSVTMLLTLTMSAASLYTPSAKANIQQIAIAHDVEVEDHIYLKYAEYVFPLVARLLVVNHSTYGVGLANLSYDHNSLFNNLTINHVLQYLLPHIAENPTLLPLIEELAALCGLTSAQLLRNAFKQVFPHIMLFEKKETVQSVMNILCKETNNTISNLLSCCVTKVLAELFIYYDEYEKKVKWVLYEIKRLATLSTPSTSKTEHPPKITELNIESFLQSRFFGVLMKLENQLCTDIISNTSRRRVLSSFKTIIRFMSPGYISSVRFKVLFTLRTITNAEKDKMPALCVEIWDVFVRRVEIALLGPILSHIFVSLLPFTRSHGQPANQIFRYLVVENRAAVVDHLMELYFVEGTRCDADIVPVIEKADGDLRAMCLQDRLEWLLKATKHEITEIKLQALRRIRRELATNRKDISQLILASDSVSSLIFRVLDTLVEGFRNLDPHLQEASGVCLGEFGAIDPSYIPNTVIKVDDAQKYHCYQIEDVDFVVTAFTLLCRGFQMAKSSASMDTFALAIQSLLTSYEVKEEAGCRYWSQIPRNLCEIILPFYSTTYTLLTHTHESNYDIPHLVYGSAKAHTVQKWAYNWSNFLISLLPADSKAKEVFTYCKGPMSCEIKCMLFFLPHILLNAVLAADPANLSKIYEEMIAVIRCDQHGTAEEMAAQKTSTQLVASEELSVISSMDLEMGIICTKTMFNLLDVLYKKYRDQKLELKGRPNAHCKQLDDFLRKFSMYQLAEKAFERKEYVRSLLYLEEYLGGSEVHVDQFLVLLAKIYVHLNDVDNVKGLFAAHSMKLHQLQNVIMLHEITDQFQDAAICYQQLLKTSTDEERALVYEKRMIQCYLAMNQPETALRFVNSLSERTRAKNGKFFYDVECEALWNLSQFDRLEKLTGSKSAQLDDTWGMRIGQSIIHFLNGDEAGLAAELQRIRGTLTKALHMSTAAFGGYRESYEHCVKLHILNEFEKIAELVFSVANKHVTDADWQLRFDSVVRTEFEERLNKLQPTSRALRPVLNLRQTLFSVAGRLLADKRPQLVPLFDEEKHKCWLKVVEIANRARNFQLAYSNIIAIDQYQLKGFFIEKAKYYWEKMEQQESLRTLQHGLKFHFSNLAALRQQPNRADEQRICAEAYMLWGTYNDAIANTDSATNLEYFKNACSVCKNTEKTWMSLAQYIDKVVCAKGPPDEIYRLGSNEHLQVIEYFGKSLMFGCEFIYQSLSRMLNVWLDFANCIQNDRTAGGGSSGGAAATTAQSMASRTRILERMLQLVDTFVSKLPAYYFLTSFSLIMSRIMHPTAECFDRLQTIVTKCALHFPHQTLWQFLSLYRPEAAKGVEKTRNDRALRVLRSQQLLQLQPTIQKYMELFKEFSKLCRAPTSGGGVRVGKCSMRELMNSGSQLMEAGYFDTILIPAQKFLTIVLPRQMSNAVSAQPDPNYKPFPERMVFVACVERHANVYASMQKPVRVGLIGTDGVVYPTIFKAMDDMRIDSRAMEFNAVVNMYLKRDVEARDRGLRVRTYTVLPLTDCCGIIEFIPRLETMRSVIDSWRRTIAPGEGRIKDSLKYRHEDSAEKKAECFAKLRQLYPPVLHEWYKQEFPNPSSWYAARTAYVRTLAVMSIVGYVLGLGDRHTDNILLDRTNGDVIHVDFNALFNKGETLPVPELVPFRLTHSMVKAMGPLGYEGGFLCTCELVNRILRSRKDQLLSVLNTFRYDPLNFTAATRRSVGELHRAAEVNLKNVRARLNGSVRTPANGNSLPLSVEGQTRKLIEEATDIKNLHNMFFGWGAYI